MPREEQYLGDIVQAAEHVASFLTGIDREAFLASELTEVPWRAVVGM